MWLDGRRAAGSPASHIPGTHKPTQHDALSRRARTVVGAVPPTRSLQVAEDVAAANFSLAAGKYTTAGARSHGGGELLGRAAHSPLEHLRQHVRRARSTEQAFRRRGSSSSAAAAASSPSSPRSAGIVSSSCRIDYVVRRASLRPWILFLFLVSGRIAGGLLFKSIKTEKEVWDHHEFRRGHDAMITAPEELSKLLLKIIDKWLISQTKKTRLYLFTNQTVKKNNIKLI